MPTGSRRERSLQEQPVLVVDITSDGRGTVVAVEGELDVATAPLFCQQLAEVLGDGWRGDLVIDLADADFVGVAGIEALAHVARRLRDDGGNLVLRSPSPLTQRVLEIGRLTSLFAVDDRP